MCDASPRLPGVTQLITADWGVFWASTFTILKPKLDFSPCNYLFWHHITSNNKFFFMCWKTTSVCWSPDELEWSCCHH